jgi:hypothetical protein
MGAAFAVIYWIGAIGCSTYFWFSYARTRSAQPAPIKRLMTMGVFLGWPVYLGYQVLQRQSATGAAPASREHEAKKRILG